MLRVKSQFEIKELDEKAGILICYPSIFNNIDSDKEMITPGAFVKTIGERGPESSKPRIKHLWQHDRYTPIAVPRLLKEDSKGLYAESVFGNDQFSKDKLQQHIDGIITEMSIGFEVIKSEPAMQGKEEEYKKLTELRLWEYSSVTWGANSMTEIVAVKGNKKDAIEVLNERMNKFIKALRNPKYTDESLESFELEIKQIQSIINELLQEPPKSTPEPSAQDTLTEFRKLLKF